MEETKHDTTNDGNGEVRSIVRGAIEEFLRMQQSKTEPAYKIELLEERKKREQLERRINELAEENRRTRLAAEELDRGATIRAELQRLGVTKVDLAFKAVKEDITRAEDGRLIARTETGDIGAREYLTKFLSDNPELLPGRIQGGSGAGAGHTLANPNAVDLDKIRPGMSSEELDRVRQEIVRVASHTIRGA
ncbi:MAG: hypothetical protein WKF37_12070 [Bryobacteraceae bacterium]